jgi:hypothetical protein
MQRWANKYLRQINGILQPASAYGIIAATDPTGALAAVLCRLPRSFSPRLFAQASGATRRADAATVCAGAVLCWCWSGWRPVEQRGDAKGRGTYPGGCCVRSPGRLARRRTSQCSRQGVDSGRPTLREQRDGVWGIFGAWVREWAGMTRGGEKARDGPWGLCD